MRCDYLDWKDATFDDPISKYERTDTMEPVLTTSSLSKKYGSFTALDGIDLSIPAGRIVGLLGPNGSGKTTLIKLIAGLLTPSAGQIHVCGNHIGRDSKALVSYLPDRVYFNPDQKIISLLDFFQDLYEDFDRSRAENMLSQLGIREEAKFKELSKGSREKVQLALVMSRRAKLYLLVEPIAGVDPAARDYIIQTVVTNYDPSATVIISTHLIADIEPILDDYIVLYQGKIMRQGSVEEERQKSGRTLDELFREVFRCLPNY